MKYFIEKAKSQANKNVEKWYNFGFCQSLVFPGQNSIHGVGDIMEVIVIVVGAKPW